MFNALVGNTRSSNPTTSTRGLLNLGVDSVGVAYEALLFNTCAEGKGKFAKGAKIFSAIIFEYSQK